MENFNGERDDIDIKTGPHPYQSPRFQPPDHPIAPCMVPSPPEPTPPQHAVRPTHTRTRSSPSKHRSAPVDMRPHLPTMSGTRPLLPLPLVPVPSYTTATNSSRNRESTLLSPKLPSDPTPSMPLSPAPPYQATVSSPVLTRPGCRRRDTTCVTRSLGLSVVYPTSPPATGLAAGSKSRRRDTSPSGLRPSLGLGITTPVPPTPSTPPALARARASASHKLYPVQGSSNITITLPVARVRRATSPAPSLFITSTTQPTAESFVPLKSPRMLDPETQSAMDDLVSQANVLGALDNATHMARDRAVHPVLQSPAALQEVQKPSRVSVSDGQDSLVHGEPDHSCGRPNYHSATQDKENHHMRSPQRGRAGSEGTKRTPGSFKNPVLGRSNHAPERTACATVDEEEKDTVKEVKRSRAGSEGASKRGLVRKSRRKYSPHYASLPLKTILAAALDLAPATPVFPARQTFHITSPTSTPITPLFSPVVGEFRGWFSNLFNWKTPTYILHSHNNCSATRDETARLLVQFGVSVVLEDGQGWGVLRCKVDDMAGQSAHIIIDTDLLTRVTTQMSMGWSLRSKSGSE
jgi:hypothetical protein